MRNFWKILTLTVSLMTILIYSVEAQSKKPTPNSLDDQSLCDMATYGMSDSKLWKLGTYIVYVNEAKSRGLECGVKKLLQGDIRDLKSSEVKLYLTHLGYKML